MSYKIAYGVNRSVLKSRQLIDKFLVATLNNDEEAIKEILDTMLPRQETRIAPASKSAPKTLAKSKTEPFTHLSMK
jgi:Zn-dependent M16 (insulinase) family peptidase